MSKAELVLLLMGGAMLSIFGITIPLLLLYAIYVTVAVVRYHRTHNDLLLVKIILFSIIIPNNYIISGVILAVAAACFIRDERRKRLAIPLLIIMGCIVISALINHVAIMNLILAIFYYSPAPLAFYIMKCIKWRQKNSRAIVDLIQNVILVEFLCVLLFAVTHIPQIISSIDTDWVTGTFGIYQGNNFFFFILAGLVINLQQYHKTKDRRSLTCIIVTAVMLIMTGSIALILITAASAILYALFIKKHDNKKWIRNTCGVIVVAIIGFVVFTPNWILRHIGNLVTNPQYVATYVSKLDTYEKTFIDIPNNDISFLFFGNGIGNYSSRGALTATGIYIPWYVELFEPSMSEYTAEYIYPQLESVMTNHLGVLDTPYSSVISIQGEFGIIGLIILTLLAILLLRKSRNESFIFMLAFCLACFVENYLEFPKVVALLAFIYCYFQALIPKKKAQIIVSSSSIGYGADKSMIQVAKKIKSQRGGNPIVVLSSFGRTCDMLDEARIPYIIIPFKNWIHYDTSIMGVIIKPIIKLMVNTFESLRTYAIIAGRYNIEYVYSNSFTNYYSIWISKLFDAPHYQHVREFGDKDFGWHFDFGQTRTVKYAIKNSEKIICISDAVKEHYRSFADSNKIVRVYNGLPITKEVKHDYAQEPIHIVMVGRLSEEKGQDTLVEAAKLLIKRGVKNFHIDIIGDGEKYDGIYSEINKNDLGQYITLKGYLDRVDYSPYLIGVICSRSEAFGRVTVEYMMNNLAVVGARSGATPEIITDNKTGVLYDPGDEVSLAKCLAEVITNPAETKRLGIAARRYAIKHFSETQCVESIYDIINNEENKQ